MGGWGGGGGWLGWWRYSLTCWWERKDTLGCVRGTRVGVGGMEGWGYPVTC